MLSVNPNKTEMILFTRRYKPEQLKEGSMYPDRFVNRSNLSPLSRGRRDCK